MTVSGQCDAVRNFRSQIEQGSSRKFSGTAESAACAAGSPMGMAKAAVWPRPVVLAQAWLRRTPRRSRSGLSQEKEHLMKSIINSVRRLVNDEQGMETVEWGVMAALIVAALVTAISTLGGNVLARFNQLVTATQ